MINERMGSAALLHSSDGFEDREHSKFVNDAKESFDVTERAIQKREDTRVSMQALSTPTLFFRLLTSHVQYVTFLGEIPQMLFRVHLEGIPCSWFADPRMWYLYR